MDRRTMVMHDHTTYMSCMSFSLFHFVSNVISQGHYPTQSRVFTPTNPMPATTKLLRGDTTARAIWVRAERCLRLQLLFGNRRAAQTYFKGVSVNVNCRFVGEIRSKVEPNYTTATP